MTRRARASADSRPRDRDQAFRALFSAKTFAALWHWLDRLGVPLRDRRDMAQDVLLAAVVSFHTYDPMRSRPERWLNRIAVHAAAHYRDKAQHRREELTPDPLLDSADPAPLACERIEAAQQRLHVFDLVQSLDPELRAVVVGHDLDGIPMDEIAAQQGIPVSTAYKRRARGLAALAAAYQRTEDR